MKRLFAVMLLCGFVSPFMFSQDSNSELLKKLVDKNILTQAEADEISREDVKKEEKQNFAQSLEKIRDAFNTPYMKFGGYGLLLYKYSQYDKVHHDLNARVLFLSMEGRLTDHFRYFILYEFTDPRLYEFYGEWMPSDFFKLRGGQFKIPFSFENPISLTDLETISNTRSVSSLVGMTGDPIQWSKGNGNRMNQTGRDIGIQVSGSLFNNGSHDLVQYAAGMFQGTGLGVKENNGTKDFVGNIAVQPIKDLRIAGGLYAGKAVYHDKDHGRNRWIVGSDYKSDRLYARAEWIHGNDGGIKKEGLYGTALCYIMPNKLNFVGKIDYFNENKDTDREVIDYLVGVNYYFWGKCRFQLNYTYSDFSKNWHGHSSENTVQAQMQIVF